MGHSASEDIRDYGGIANSDSIEAIEANIQAIHNASVEAKNNTVYLPEGEWFIGSLKGDTGSALQPGCVDANQGVAGLGFVGEGPEKTFLYWGKLDSDHNNNIRYCAADHSGAMWKNLTYGGRWRHFASKGHDFSAAGQWGITIEGDARGDLTLENVRLQGMAGNGIFMGFGLDLDLTINRCTFYDNGIGINQATGGNRHQHHIAAYADDNSSLTVTNSEFRLCSGVVINCNGPANGDGVTRVENVYAESAGISFHKINNPGTVINRNLYFKGETQEIIDEMVDTPRANFFHRLAGDKTYTPTLVLHDVKLVHLPGWGFRATDGYPLTIRGGTDGPVAMDNIATLDNRPEALSGSDTSITFDAFGNLSVYNVNGDVASLGSSDGSIDTLHWARADSLGDVGEVIISNEKHGADSYAPVTPSQSAVGINSLSDVLIP